MTKPSDFSPTQAIELHDSDNAKQSNALPWLLRLGGLGVVTIGWAAVALADVGSSMFIVDTVVFIAMAVYAFGAATVSRIHAVSQERRLRLRLLVHNMELENMSMRDELTQLFNRRYMFERLDRELQTAKGFHRPLAFIAIELRSLNEVNRTYGYEAGDKLLVGFGRFLMDYTRATDIPARLSGRRFGVILPDTSKRGAYTMIDRLVQALANTDLLGEAGVDRAVVASFGVSGHPWGADTVDGLVQQAEAEMAAGDPITADEAVEAPREKAAAAREDGE